LFFFHFGDALEFVSLYNQSGHFAAPVKIITTIALVPIDEIDNAWAYIVSIDNFDDENILDHSMI
jgi:hypothetical protein